MKYTAQQFEEMTGNPPIQDDLERLNCDGAGSIGHGGCGLCPEHNKPRFICGCFNMSSEEIKCNISPGVNISK
jgi:hypothetical protein